MRSDIAVKIKYSESAIKDLEAIGDYIADTLKNPSVFIDRVIYGRRDYIKILFDESLENRQRRGSAGG